MDLIMDSSAVWSTEIEGIEQEARLIHECEWQIEMMRPFEYPQFEAAKVIHGETSNAIISFRGCSSSSLRPKEEAVSDQFDRRNIGVHQSVNSETERKRREKLNQGFIHLSSLLPNLKKLDKGSVLAEAASYVKHLQERVKVLEEQTSKKATKSVVSDGKFSSTQDHNSSSPFLSGDNFGVSNSSDDRLPEVQVRISDKDVLIKVHCERNEGMDYLPKVSEEIQNLNLEMINCSAMEFGKYDMIITILAKMNDEFSTTSNNLMLILQRSLQAL